MPRVCDLRAYLGSLHDLIKTRDVLQWDQLTMMPAAAADARSQALATLAGIIHEKQSSPLLGDLLAASAAETAALAEESDERSLVRVARRHYDRATKLPADFVAALSRAASRGYHDWIAAREANDFTLFADALEELVRLRREEADIVRQGTSLSRYDALLDENEPGISETQLQTLFEELRAVLVPLVQQVRAQPLPQAASLLRGDFPPDDQWQLSLAGLKAIGFDIGRGRLDRSVHPFTTSFAPTDVRLTTRISTSYAGQGLFGSLHEGGHGIYAQGIPQRFARTPLDDGASGGIHESQSRLYENLVGRSEAFWRFFLPIAARHLSQLKGASVKEIFQAVNVVRPSLIRVEADEVTYNLHIALRFDLERELLAGSLSVRDLPDAWNTRMRSDLGVDVPGDLQGVLQDIHWSDGSFASFPGYTIGNVASVQWLTAAKEAYPDLDDAMASGDLGPLHSWLQENVYDFGAKLPPNRLLERATGRPLDPQPYLGYIRAKYGSLYALDL